MWRSPPVSGLSGLGGTFPTAQCPFPSISSRLCRSLLLSSGPGEEHARRGTHSALSGHIPHRHSGSQNRRLRGVSAGPRPSPSVPERRHHVRRHYQPSDVQCLSVPGALVGTLAARPAGAGRHSPGIQMHRKAPLSSRHVPSFWHGFESHSLMLISHLEKQPVASVKTVRLVSRGH